MSEGLPEIGVETRRPEGRHLYHVPEPTLEHGLVTVDGAEVEYTREFLEETTETLAIIVPGFGGFKRTSRNLRGALASQREDVASYDPVRREALSNRDRLFRPQATHKETVRLIHNDIYPSKKAVLFAHSMGGLSATEYAHENPDRVSAIVFLGAAGFGSPTLSQLARTRPSSLVGMISQEIVPFVMNGGIDASPRNIMRFIGYYASNPVRTTGEALSCLHHDMRDKVHDLGRLGVSTVYLQFEHDFFVPEADASSCDVHDILPGTGHMAPLAKPGRVAQWYRSHKNEILAALI